MDNMDLYYTIMDIPFFILRSNNFFLKKIDYKRIIVLIGSSFFCTCVIIYYILSISCIIYLSNIILYNDTNYHTHISDISLDIYLFIKS